MLLAATINYLKKIVYNKGLVLRGFFLLFNWKFILSKLAVVVTSPAHSNLTATAIDFVNTVVMSKHELVGVFFYQDGVLNANKYTSIPSDEFQSCTKWAELNKEHGIPLHLCITAAEKRGLSDESELNTIDEHFTVSGLGELVELTSICDRVIQL